MNKLFKISARVAYSDFKVNLISLSSYFQKMCGEKIPGLPDVKTMESMDLDELESLILNNRNRVIGVLKGFPAYPAVTHVIDYLRNK